MLIAALLCFSAGAVSAGFGARALARQQEPATGVQQVLRAVAPTQFAAAVMLVAGGVVALSARPATGLVVVIVCVIGAVGTVAAGAWQWARCIEVAARSKARCDGSCATCTLSCR
jgi:hypothetical protein